MKSSSQNNIPHETKSLLVFANLGMGPRNQKRKLNIIKPDFSELSWLPRRGNKEKRALDENGNIWIKSSPEKDPVFERKIERFPKEEFERRFKPRGIAAVHNESDCQRLKFKIESLAKFNQIWIEELWYRIRHSLALLTDGINEGAEDLLNECLNPADDEPRGPEIVIQRLQSIDGEAKQKASPAERMDSDLARHGVISLRPASNNSYQAVLAYFANFYLNQEELHPLLRLCPACGRFFIKYKKNQIFCIPSCEDFYNQLSKERKNEIKQTSRDRKRKQKEFRELMDLVNRDTPDGVDRARKLQKFRNQAETFFFEQGGRLKNHPFYRSYHGLK
jgi:hypothetical protein